MFTSVCVWDLQNKEGALELLLRPLTLERRLLNVGTQDPNEEAENEVFSLSIVPGIEHLLGNVETAWLI